jgi:hypothetical protein
VDCGWCSDRQNCELSRMNPKSAQALERISQGRRSRTIRGRYH